MTVAQLKAILVANWDAAIIAADNIEDNSILPRDFVDKGVTISDEVSDYHPAGFMRQQTDAFGGDIYRLYLMDETVANILLRVSAIIKIADNFQGDANYDRLYPRQNEIVHLKPSSESSEGVAQYRKMAEMPILCNKNNVNLYT